MSLAWWWKSLRPRDAIPVAGGLGSRLGECGREALMMGINGGKPGLGFEQGLDLLCRTLHVQAQQVGSHPDPGAAPWCCWEGARDGTWAVTQSR